MSKINFETLASGYTDVELLNRNFQRIAEWSDTVLSRLGEAPNQMQADIDLNGHGLLNTSLDLTNPNSVVSFASMAAYVDQRAAGIVQMRRHSAVATAAQTGFPLPDFTYEPGTNNLVVYVDGVRQFSPTDYTETDNTAITFVNPMVGGEQVEIFSTAFIGNIALPPHTHVWADLLGVPVTATRWPTYDEVTGKPATYPPATHSHPASAITSGRLADARRGVHVQSSEPSDPAVGDLWIW